MRNRPYARIVAAIILSTAILATCATAQETGKAPPDAKRPKWNERNILRLGDIPRTEAIEFIFCSDLHVPWDDNGTVGKIAKKANEILPDFILLGGDLVQVGNPRSFKALRKAFKRFKSPIISAIGNHDTSFEDYSDQVEWGKRFGDSYYFFDVGPARFIFLNNANYVLPAAQLDFLEDALKTDLKKFIIMHRPVGYLNPLYTTPLGEGSDRFRKLVEAAGVTAVFTGHEHHYAHYEIAGVNYIVSGGAGGRLNTNTKNNFHHFILARVSVDGFDFQVIRI